jgi:hypothetical protein
LKRELKLPVIYSNRSIYNFKELAWTFDNSYKDLKIDKVKGQPDQAQIYLKGLDASMGGFVEYLEKNIGQSNFYKINDYFYAFSLPSLDKTIPWYSNANYSISYYLIYSIKDGKIRFEYLYIFPPLYNPNDGPC